MKTNFINKHGSKILAAMASAGVVATVVNSHKNTIKAMSIIEEEIKNSDHELTRQEKIKIAIPAYIPTIISATSTIVCIFGANILNVRSQAGLSSAYMLLDQTYKSYRKKVIEMYGEEADQDIQNKIMLETASHVSISCENLGSWCDLSLDDCASLPVTFYDPIGHRFFEQTIEQVLMAEYHLNRNYILGGCVSVNMFYEFLGLDPIEGGDDLVWSIDGDLYWIDFNHRRAKIDDDMECYIIEFPWGPSPAGEYE